MAPHPFDPLTVSEITKATKVLKEHHKGKLLHIKTAERYEPPKEYMKKFLDAERAGNPIAPPPRLCHLIYYILEERRVSELWVRLDDLAIVEYKQHPAGVHPPIDPWEAEKAVEIIWKDPRFLAAIEKCGMTDKLECVTCDGWMYGSNVHASGPQRLGLADRLMMALMYCRDPKTNNPDSNMYAFPLPFVPIFDIFDGKLLRIDWVASGNDSDDANGNNYNTRAEGSKPLDTCKAAEYIPELQPSLRTDLKPYNVVQPEGPSFTCNGNEISWQKWKFRVSFTPREGLVLHNVTFDGRQTFYRLAVEEMVVPYFDPRGIASRRCAFDFGDCGGGKTANELNLGCDCLGTIKYFNGNVVDPTGNVIVRKNVICMHEQDDGINLKHTNYRTGRPIVQRRRILVLQIILTVGNYEYIFAWHFDQNAGIKLDIRATGIVSTTYIDGGKTVKWGTVVSPSVLAASHQHIFNVRIDPAIDGHNNTVAYCDTERVPYSIDNPDGNAAFNKVTYVDQSCFLDVDIPKNRYVKIVNENKKNPISGNPIGYKLYAAPTALLMAQPDSVIARRAAFATHAFWITKYKDHEFYPGGPWTNQSSWENGGVLDAVERKDNVRNTDVVLWHSFGLTHHPRVEDFPVMSVEMLNVMLMPNDFFTTNPGMDIPASTQKFNRSVEVMETKCCKI